MNYDFMSDELKKLNGEEKSKKMLKKENLIVDLEMTIEKRTTN